MKHQRTLIAITLLVIGLVAASLYFVSANDLSGYGSAVSAGASLLAVLWFSASLRYQSIQLEEQRSQFLVQFKQIQEATKRDSLLMCKSILDAAEDRVIQMHGGISSSAELVGLYMKFDDLAPLLNSVDPQEVFDTYQLWIKKEGAAMALLRGIKAAAEVYLRSTNVPNIDYTKAPEDFVFIYGCWFWKLPFFDAYEGTGALLSEFMMRLQPGREAATIANFAAMAKMGMKNFLHMDKIQEQINKHKEAGRALPKIAENL